MKITARDYETCDFESDFATAMQQCGEAVQRRQAGEPVDDFDRKVCLAVVAAHVAEPDIPQNPFSEQWPTIFTDGLRDYGVDISRECLPEDIWRGIGRLIMSSVQVKRTFYRPEDKPVRVFRGPGDEVHIDFSSSSGDILLHALLNSDAHVTVEGLPFRRRK